MPNHTNPHRCNVKLVGRNCEHQLCVLIGRGVPPELRCDDEQPRGYGPGVGAACCPVPAHLDALVERELRDNLQEAKRQGFVLVPAA